MPSKSIAVLLALCVSFSASASDLKNSDWPSINVKIEELTRRNNFVLEVPGIVVKGKVSGPTILRVHIDATGTPIRTQLVDTCGSHDLDIAAMDAMRKMRFEPSTSDGQPVPVTLIVPIHIPKKFGRPF